MSNDALTCWKLLWGNGYTWIIKYMDIGSNNAILLCLNNANIFVTLLHQSFISLLLKGSMAKDNCTLLSLSYTFNHKQHSFHTPCNYIYAPTWHNSKVRYPSKTQVRFKSILLQCTVLHTQQDCIKSDSHFRDITWLDVKENPPSLFVLETIQMLYFKTQDSRQAALAIWASENNRATNSFILSENRIVLFFYEHEGKLSREHSAAGQHWCDASWHSVHNNPNREARRRQRPILIKRWHS